MNSWHTRHGPTVAGQDSKVPMKATLYYFTDCPSYTTALENLKEALRREGLPEDVKMVSVADEAQAKAAQFIGSPTIRINGVDVEGAEAEHAGYGFACRVYADGAKRAGWPSVEQVQQALRRESHV